VKLAREGAPIVLIDRVAENVRCDSVVVDNEGGAREAVNYLVENGHSRIAILRDESRIFTAQERFAGYRNALQAHGLGVDDSLVSVSPSTVQHAIDATIRLFSRRERPTALFTVDSLMTQGALLALRSMGLSIPRDVSLVGFDDFDLATFTDPQITVVAQPIAEIGPLAAKLLLERLEGKKTAPRHARFPTRLVVRGSVAPLKKRAKA
jgi:LacI family transcriptional regulator